MQLTTVPLSALLPPKGNPRRTLDNAQIATLARSQLAGIGAGIAFYFGEGFASIFLPDIVQYMPFAVARAAVDTGGTGAAPEPGALTQALAPDTALLLVAAWLVGSLVVAVAFTERAEITG